MKRAILELKNNNFDLTNLVDSYIESNETKLVDKKLHYKTIGEGLMFLAHLKHNKILTFKKDFETFGTMIDLSRGAVYKISYIKNLIRKKALMGANEIWLYIEDMYQLEEYPHFGYMRGSYSEDELIEIVEYASIFNIKVVPSIQTLGHMEQYLRWRKSAPVRDQANVLLAKSEDTYQLIDAMFKQMKKIFKHDKIHIGLDETWGFGFGNFYKKNGYIPQIDNFFEHLNVVNDLALKHGFKRVLMWSDMPYRILSKVNYYYDLNITLDQNIIDQIPNNVELVYWDYYQSDFDRVDKMLKNHLELTNKVIFASGTWIWTRFNYDKKQTDLTAPVHIKAANNNNIKEFILTQWGDDGAYGDHESTLLGVYEMSLKALTKNDVCSETYEFITKEALNVAYNRTKINNLKINPVGLMWDDPQFSLILANFVKNDLSNYKSHLEEMQSLLNIYKDKSEYELEYHIIAANYNKVLGRAQMIKDYTNQETISSDQYFLEQIDHLEELIKVFRKRWYTKHKMNGLEIIQARLATQIVRAKEMIEIARLYNNKEIDKIDGILDKVEVFDEVLSVKYSNVAFTTMPF